MSPSQFLILYLKGVFMGICDVIPGISGGTIAFITGIYFQLISSINAFPKLVPKKFNWLRKRNKESWNELLRGIKDLNLPFLITLFAGIGTAILLGSRLIKYLLGTYEAYTLTFFIGLILSSTAIIYSHIENHKPANKLYGAIGLLLGISLAILVPADIAITLPYIFFGGFISIVAMFLPGISGSFILLIMGLYESLLDALHSPFQNIHIIIVFGIGAVLGALTIAKIIDYIFRKDKCRALYILAGLVIGALIIPLLKVAGAVEAFTPSVVSLLGLFLILGLIAGYIPQIVADKQKNTSRKH
ncbi:TPA: DUF368 domain-containing protein [Candidatus Woesearchaeota archaeon]|nr:DUF368 domain-containing protein [Candidatus Woesearchaeota archaeon]HII69158.1 DUF368 domain-containing protein [Candidatus Woesearchaeota archaeon]